MTTQNQPSEEKEKKPFAAVTSDNIKIYLSQTKRKKRKQAEQQ